MIVPWAHGFKSIKWLQRIVLTNNFQANDTYANGNNDVESWMKTSARIVSRPAKIKAGQPVPMTGMAQVGISGLTKVQYALSPQEPTWPADDPWFTKADWKEAEILPPPEKWAGGLPGGTLPPGTLGIDASTGKPAVWPMRYSIVHWGAILTNVSAGKYDLRCRTIDEKGAAQPMPRPFRKSGGCDIEAVQITVK